MIVSKLGVSIIVMFLGFIGIEANENNVIEVVSALLTIASFVTMIYHQVIERKDVENFIFKKGE